MSRMTLFDIAALNGTDKVVGLIEENLLYAPEITIMPARQIAGIVDLTVKRTAYPGGGFVGVAGSSSPTKSTFAQQKTEVFAYQAVVQVPTTIAKAFDQGQGALEMIEASGVMKQTLLNIGAQVWNGTAADANGFPGIKQLTPTTGTGSQTVLNASGSTANVASSVYGVKWGVQGVELLTGNNSTFELSPFRDQQIVDANDSTKYVPMRVADLTCFVGLFSGSVYTQGRIYNLMDDSVSGLTDLLLSNWMAKFPVGYQPDAIFFNRKQRTRLRNSRTVTLFGQGTGRPNQPTLAPLPTEFDGIPLHVTDSIPQTDAVE